MRAALLMCLALASTAASAQTPGEVLAVGECLQGEVTQDLGDGAQRVRWVPLSSDQQARCDQANAQAQLEAQQRKRAGLTELAGAGAADVATTLVGFGVGLVEANPLGFGGAVAIKLATWTALAATPESAQATQITHKLSATGWAAAAHNACLVTTMQPLLCAGVGLSTLAWRVRSTSAPQPPHPTEEAQHAQD